MCVVYMCQESLTSETCQEARPKIRHGHWQLPLGIRVCLKNRLLPNALNGPSFPMEVTGVHPFFKHTHGQRILT